MRKLGAFVVAFALLQNPAAGISQPQDAPAAAPAAVPLQPQEQPLVPGPEALTVLIKMTLAALNQANRTNNYSVLWALGSDTFRQANTPQSMADGFAGIREARLDLSPMILLTPQLVQLPAIEQGRYLHLRGFFATQPSRIDFDLIFEPSGGQWKLSGLSVSRASPGEGTR